MFAYSEDGQHFLGYRITSYGKMQVVYDCARTKRAVYNIETPNVSGEVLGDAIKAAIRTKRVLPTLISNLSSQKIHLRESFWFSILTLLPN